MSLVHVVIVALLFVWANARPALAQSPFASIRGVVLDASRSAIPEASLVLFDEATGDARTSTTGADGGFVITAVRPGVHRLEVTARGHKKHVERLDLVLGQELRTTVALEVGAITEEVVVTGDRAPIRRDSGAVGTVIDNRLLTTLPLDGRNFFELSLLVPGAAPPAPGAAGAVRGDFTFTANGARDDANTFLLDGADNIDPKLNTAAVRPPVDAIREFEVRTSTHEASFGRQAGAQVNVVVKSGTNDLAGTAYEFYRGAFDARNYFAPEDAPAPTYQRHQFGGSVGGPLIKGRTFFFGSFEGTRRREGITRLTTVPTAAERAGDFSQSRMRAPTNPLTGQPFPGNMLPAFFINPVGRALADLYPLPNRDDGAANYVSSPAERDRAEQYDVRVTHGWSPNLQTSVRYSLGDRRLFEPFAAPGFAAVPSYGTRVPRRAQNLLADASQVLTPWLTNELRFSYGRVSAGAFQENQGTSLNRAVGLPEPWTDPRAQGLSFVTVSGLSPLGDEYNNPQHSTTNAVQVSDALTWARGAHLLKVGGDLRWLAQDAYRDVQARGFLNFVSTPYVTGNALADLLLGYPLLTGVAHLDNPQHLRTRSVGLFAQDSWRVNGAVTVSAGIRYDHQQPPADRDDRATVYDPLTRSLVQVGTGGVPRGGYEPDRNNVAPRLGLTWALPGRAETVVRAGYGVYYNQSALAPGEGLYFSPPYYQFDLFVPLPGMPPLTVEDPFPSTYPVQFPGSALSFQRDLQTPWLHQWNVGLQRGVGRSFTADVAYVGSRGRDLLSARDINQAAPSASPVNPRPDPRFADIVALESRARSRYDSLQATLQRRQVDGLALLLAYTWSSSKDDASGFFSSGGDPNFPQDSNDPAAEWGRSGFDVRHRLSASVAYALPFGRDAHRGTWQSFVGSGWHVAGVIVVQSGRPFTVSLLPEFDNSNTGRASLGFGANDRPDLVGDPVLADPTPARWFNTAAFAVSPYGSFGSARRNILEGPGYANVNLAVLKDLAVAADLRVQLRVETFNLLNHANFDLPDAFVGSPTFGQILSAQPPRRVQLGLKVLF